MTALSGMHSILYLQPVHHIFNVITWRNSEYYDHYDLIIQDDQDFQDLHDIIETFKTVMTRDLSGFSRIFTSKRKKDINEIVVNYYA